MASVSRLIPIDDAADPRIAPYVAIRERDLRRREGHFIAEGEVVLRVLLARSRFNPESLLLLDSRAAALGALLERVPADVPIYVATRPVMDRIVGFPIHRGVLALGCRGPEPAAGELLAGLPASALVLGLIGLANHDNVGGIFRNAAAFGADAVLLDRASCDPLYRKALRVSVGASLMVPFARVRDGSALLACLEETGFAPIALSPKGSLPLAGLPRHPRRALLVGAEGPGLPESILAEARSVRIPMAAGFDSLNVATASGIALYHMRSRERCQTAQNML